MFPMVDMMQCQNLAVPMDVMHHVVQIESSANPYAIGVVGGRLVRQPRSLAEAVATAEMLESRGYNFSVGLAQVNRFNLGKYGVTSYAQAFDGCTNLRAGARILSECHTRARGDWGSAFSCYYSGNFTTGYQHGYVQKIFASIASQQSGHVAGSAIPLASVTAGNRNASAVSAPSALARRIVKSDGDYSGLSISAIPNAETVLPAAPASPAASVAQSAAAPHGPESATQPPEKEGIVRLTRNGPIFPTSASQSNSTTYGATGSASIGQAQLSQNKNSALSASSGEPGDNAFVF